MTLRNDLSIHNQVTIVISNKFTHLSFNRSDNANSGEGLQLRFLMGPCRRALYLSYPLPPLTGWVSVLSCCLQTQPLDVHQKRLPLDRVWFYFQRPNFHSPSSSRYRVASDPIHTRALSERFNLANQAALDTQDIFVRSMEHNWSGTISTSSSEEAHFDVAVVNMTKRWLPGCSPVRHPRWKPVRCFVPRKTTEAQKLNRSAVGYSPNNPRVTRATVVDPAHKHLTSLLDIFGLVDTDLVDPQRSLL